MDDYSFTFTAREWQVVRFALWRFMSEANERASYFSQKHVEGSPGAFFKDAKDAENLLAKLRDTQPSKQER
jgi:hypothetical protein